MIFLKTNNREKIMILIIMNLYSNSRQAILSKLEQPNTDGSIPTEHEKGKISISIKKIIHQNLCTAEFK